MGTKQPDGAKRVAANGYHYIKEGGKWRLQHHVVAEEALGRPINKGERVVFKDGDRHNLTPDNIEVKETKGGKNGRITYLRERIERDTEELNELLLSE